MTAYEEMVAKTNEKRGKTIDTPAYPHVVPKIALTKSKMANIAITLGDEPVLFLSEGFMQLPPEQQKAFLYHEARHGFEPVTAKAEAKKYPFRRFVKNVLTLNGLSRHYEHKADENAAAFGHADALATALEHITESQIPGIRDAVGSMSAVAKAANEHGFAIDRKKAVDLIDPMALMSDSGKPKNINQKMLSPVVHLCKVMTVAAIDKGFKQFATKSADELVEGKLNPKLWIVKVGTHPPPT